MPDTINPGVPVTKYGVLWRTKPLPTDDTPPEWRLYGVWHRSPTETLEDLHAAAANQRCADARIFCRTTTYRALTRNAKEEK